jgi:hypothetical protein
MFKIAEAPLTYTWPVTVSIPANGGKYTKATLTAEFQALDQDRIDAIIGGEAEIDADLLTECLVGWKGVQDADGAELPVSDEGRVRLLKIPYVRSALVRAFFESISGGAARRKN